VALFTHTHPEQTRAAVHRLVEALGQAGVAIVAGAEEAEKHGLQDDGVGIVDDPAAAGADVAVVLGGDGSMLAALREFAGQDVPVFSFNYGAVGFLATVDDLEEGIGLLLAADYEKLHLPALVIEPAAGRRIGVNDVTFSRRSGARVARLEYSVGGRALGEARCDGLVVSTPVGSTGYNLANGGPVLAWGAEGYVVTFIAPHTMAARTLVAGTDDVLSVRNLSEEEPVDVETDGRRVCTLEPGQDLEVHFEEDQVLLAQRPESGFYGQLAAKFGPLVS
jgi:NAD+ kinase